ncbi:putative cellulose binding protein,putative carbohydrate binding protein [Actinoalloteichus fjordicus]|uniref:Endoglucanase n=1 Tax=Actinoalloteichus fjordicus TaxID=1612552 RepID=A0AAC9L9P0_9PSEU|nr:putative cellulose binding protein,putative carbohydrate binding protein [Actinoalloteichus fjordicus]
MRRPVRRRGVPLLVAAVTIPLLGTAVPQAAAQEETEQISNGDFAEGTAPWWWTPTAPAAVVDGALCAEVEGDTINPWDAIVGHSGIHLQPGESYALSFTASASAPVIINTNVQLSVEPYTQELSERTTLGAEPVEFSYAFTSGADTENAQVAFQLGGAAEPWTFCLDDVSLRGGEAPPPYEPDTGPRVRVNQVGYLPSGPKQATVVTDAAEALPWELTDAAGAVVAEGQTVPQGVDPSSDEATHGIDFSEVTAEATGLTLSADGETSHPFDIDAGLYDTLRTDALAFFYHQRSGIEIEAEHVGEDYARPAGHLGVAPNLGDIEVPCQPGVCDYTLDVSGGWYDAGDHGKYVVNGGISAAQVMGVYERALVEGDTEAVADGTLSIPEQANGVPDVLDEARWQLEFLLSMQVPAGEEQAGLVHHKIHDAAWTGLPLLPHRDPQTRELHPVSTAATLNLAAAGAQCARLFADFDQAFADRCLASAETAWDAANAHPIHYADPLDGIGGGAYSDSDVTDEFYWAAAELYLTTGAADYLDAVTSSEHHGAQAFTDWGFGWAVTGPLGLLNLATVPSDLPADQLALVRAAVVDGASRYAETAANEVYGLPYAPEDHAYVWGSNSQVLNNMVVLGVAYDLTGDAEFRDAVLTGWDYLLGGNPLNVSYVTGYGEYDARNQHHRFWANQLDPSLPNPPAGSVAGGPNVSLDDPVAAEALAGCAPAFCYIDDIESWSTNEVTINWNAPLAWVAAFTADVAGADGPPTEPPAGTCDVSYLVQSQWNNGFTTQVSITNTGDEPVQGWALDWTFDGDQRVTHSWNTQLVQRGAAVSAADIGWNATIAPGRSVTFGFNGSFSGTNGTPGAFTLNGDACA